MNYNSILKENLSYPHTVVCMDPGIPLVPSAKVVKLVLIC